MKYNDRKTFTSFLWNLETIVQNVLNKTGVIFTYQTSAPNSRMIAKSVKSLL